MGKKVSVHIITYNHERFIAQAVESAVNQEVDFDYEIVIGEDCSTDRTREIVIELGRQYPDKIRLLLPEKNLGGRGKINFIQTLQACRGEYVALLDGDDYWNSPRKLQRQADFLDSHPDCALCFHDVLIQRDSAPNVLERMCSPEQKETSTLEDAVNSFVPPATAMFRNHLFGELPRRFYRVHNGDWFLYMLTAEHGNLHYMNEVMAVYRVHDRGVWSELSYVQQLRAHIMTYREIDAHLKFKYSHLISPKVSALRALLLRECGQQARSCLDQYHKLVRAGQLARALPPLLAAVRLSPSEVLRPRRLAAVFKNGVLGALRQHTSSGGV